MPQPAEFSDGEIDGVVVVELTTRADDRGWLMELFRSDEVLDKQVPTMGYASETKPGITRGPHEHRHQTDHFVVNDEGEFEFCLWDARSDSATRGRRMIFRAGGERPVRITVPPGVVHAYKNVSNRPAQLLNSPNRLYAGKNRQEPVDEIRYEDVADHSYRW